MLITVALIIGVILLGFGLFMLFTTHYWFLLPQHPMPPTPTPNVQGPICGILNIPLPNQAMGNTKYWCHDA